MDYSMLNLLHVIGAILIGGGLIGVWMSDLRSRQVQDLRSFSEAIRNIAVFYDGVVVPGALLLLVSGTWMIVTYHGGWDFIETPWLAGMVALFAFEFIEGHTITRRYFMRMRRLATAALAVGHVTDELRDARGEGVPTFTHFLDLPILLLIVMLGSLKPDTWQLFLVGSAVAIAIASALTFLIPRLYPTSLSGKGE